MALTITGGASSISIRKVDFDKSINSFLCYDDPALDPVFSLALPFAYPGDSDPAFTEKVYLFHNELMSGAKLFKLKLKDRPGDNKMAGYVFPMSALFNNPEIFDNVHHRKVAFIVIRKLLEEADISVRSRVTNYRSDSSYNLFDFYNENYIVTVISDQQVSFPNYSFEDYLPGFYKLGFRFAPMINFNPPRTDCNTIVENFTNLQSSITLRKPENTLHNNFFIKSLLNNELSQFENQIARFHLYYQVVEFLVEKVYKNEVRLEVITPFSGLSAFDIKDILRETMRDGYSLKKLVSGEYCKMSSDIVGEVKNSIEAFFNYIGINRYGDDIDTRLYKLRNHLFHGYSKVLEQNRLDRNIVQLNLKKVNDAVEYMIVELTMSYTDRVATV